MITNSVDTVLTITPNPAVDFMLTANNWLRGEVNKGHNSYVKAGGKGINVATALAQLNIQNDNNIRVQAGGWLGQGNEEIFVKHFHRNSIEDVFIRVLGDTRTNVKITDNGGNNSDTTDINFLGITVEPSACIALQQQIEQSITKDTICVLAGSVAIGIADEFYTDIIPIIRKKSRTVILDTSGKLLENVIANSVFPHVMKPNIHELRAVSGQQLRTDQQIITYSKPWFNKGLELLVVSLGEAGALFISANDTVKVIPPRVTVTTTVGAGDAMVAGICYGLINQLPLIELAQFATALSVAKITGKDDELSLSAYVQTLLPQVTVSSID